MWLWLTWKHLRSLIINYGRVVSFDRSQGLLSRLESFSSSIAATFDTFLRSWGDIIVEFR